MRQAEFVIIGAGPAGLSAAKSVLDAGGKVLIIDRSHILGGQLSKQTHMFFGSEKEHASKRGIDILDILVDDIKHHKNLEILTETTVVGLYEDKVVSCVKHDTYFKIKAQTIIVASGASEKALPFENNDIPGVYAAGAVQTLMNVYGVKPGHKVIMVGSGNIGLIVAYQLMQAGVKVVKLVEAASTIGGYLVHASKIRRLGVEILTNTSVKKAIGKESVEAVEIWKLDESWQGIPGTEEIFEVDTICIAVGLAPLTELLQQVGAEVVYIRELGGNVPKINFKYETTVSDVYACGDVAGIEEASSAMIAGRITGFEAAIKRGYKVERIEERLSQLRQDLVNLRNGPHGVKVRIGIEKLGVTL
ncbi:NAD(P)/FAD-dependent oxidoreductase [Liberiplasma polymorphum]|uniref:NAD(P)/FAD-dependent oxidoreductase n=1 Tax=Liberiplasma polymorphum TaxID=3374570 RepID=UPI0037749048